MAEYSVILYKSKTLAGGQHPVMLRVSHAGKRIYKSLGFSCLPQLWDDKKGLVKRGHPDRDAINNRIADELGVIRERVSGFKIKGKPYTASQVIEGESSHKVTILGLMDEIVDTLKTNNRTGNAKVYRMVYSRLRSYLKGNDIELVAMDYLFLRRYEAFLRKSGNSEVSLSVHFRTLRAVFNEAIKRKVIPRDAYPFTDFRISSFDTSTTPRAISKEDIAKIAAMDISPKTYAYHSRNYFLFMYYMGGINWVDLIQLRWSSVKDGRVEYIRSKTGKPIRFLILPPAQAILDHYKLVTGQHLQNYIFPILDRHFHKSEAQMQMRRENVLRLVNRDLKKIGQDLGLPIPLTTYVSRHTFATVLKKEGRSTSVISELLNHSSEKVTQVYLDKFDSSTTDAALEGLL